MIKNGVVQVLVLSNSGITDWFFELDFNDYGEITGTYWLRSDNKDSIIPEKMGELIQNTIEMLYEENE